MRIAMPLAYLPGGAFRLSSFGWKLRSSCLVWSVRWT